MKNNPTRYSSAVGDVWVRATFKVKYCNKIFDILGVRELSSPETKMALEIKYYAHKVGVNVHHLEWCTKYRYEMFKQDKYKKLCEEILREAAQRHKILIRELFVMPEHIHMSVETLPSMSQSKTLQLLKGNLSYQLFRAQPKFRFRYPQGHFFSPGAFASSVGYNTVEVVDSYVRNQEDIHQLKLGAFTAGSPAL